MLHAPVELKSPLLSPLLLGFSLSLGLRETCRADRGTQPCPPEAWYPAARGATSESPSLGWAGAEEDVRGGPCWPREHLQEGIGAAFKGLCAIPGSRALPRDACQPAARWYLSGSFSAMGQRPLRLYFLSKLSPAPSLTGASLALQSVLPPHLLCKEPGKKFYFLIKVAFLWGKHVAAKSDGLNRMQKGYRSENKS